MKARKLTFFVVDGDNNTAHVVQHETYRRTLQEAFEEAVAHRLSVRFNIDVDAAFRRFTLMGAVKGLVQWLDDTKPLRRPTPDEVKRLEQIEATESYEKRNARIIDSGYQAYAREEGHIE